MKNIYTNGSYWKNSATYHLGDSLWKGRHLVSLLTSPFVLPKLIAQKNKINICDIGCGAGGVLNSLITLMNKKNIICKGVGYDISPAAIKKARLLFPNISFQVADVINIHKKYDLTLLIDVLEHVNDPHELLVRCFEISPIIVIHLPLDYNYWGMLLRGKDYFDYLKRDREHIHYYCKDTAFNLVRSAKAKILAWEYTKWGIEHCFDKSKSGKVAKIARRVGFRINGDLSIKILGGASIKIVCQKM